MAKKSQNLGTAILWLQANGKGLEAALLRAEKQITKFSKKWGRSLTATGKSLSNAGAAVTRLGAMGAAAFTAIYLVVNKLTAAYDIQAAAEAQLEATLKSTGNAAGLTADELKGMASALQNVTAFGDEAIIGAESLLLTFKNIKKDAFEPALEIILDMSTAMKTDLKSSSILVGKALNDPVKGLSALSRVGVQFSEDQKKVIKSFVETGNVAGAQAVIMKELESQFGGSARAFALTAGGLATQTANVWGDILESLGGMFTNARLAILEALNPIVKKIQEWVASHQHIGDSINEFVTEVIPALKKELSDLSDKYWPIIKATGQWILDNPKLVAGWAVWAAKITVVALVLGPVLFGLGQIFMTLGSLVFILPKLLTVFKFTFSEMGIALAVLAVAAAAFIEMWESGDWTQNFLTRWVDSIDGAAKKIDWFFDKLVALQTDSIIAITLFFAAWRFGLINVSYSMGILVGLISKLLPAFTFATVGMGAALALLAVPVAAFIQMWSSGDWTRNFLTNWTESLVGGEKVFNAFFEGILEFWTVTLPNAISAIFGLILDTFSRGITGLLDLLPDWAVGGRGSSGSNHGGGDGSNSVTTPRFAAGGVMKQSGLAMVGERGPEIVAMPAGAQVFPNGSGPSTGGGITINGPLIGSAVIRETADVRALSVQLAREIMSNLRRQGVLA